MVVFFFLFFLGCVAEQHHQPLNLEDEAFWFGTEDSIHSVHIELGHPFLLF